MGMFDKLKKQFAKKKPVVVDKPKKAPEKTAKEIATEKGEPYVAILSMDVDPNNITQGAFELDWNDVFVARLVKAGYMMNPKDVDSVIVDRWFTTVCRNVALETWEQYEAMNPERDRVVKSRNIGDGYSEVS